MFVDEEIEVLQPDLPRGRFRSVLFDFDGTLSLIREGWPQVMVPMMVAALRGTGTAETEAELTAAVEEFVMRLNGRQTIYQMIQLAEEVKKRGGQPLEPLVYKHEYHARLMRRIQGRHDALSSGTATPHDWTVPGSHAIIDRLKRRGLTLYLASGTDVAFVRRELFVDSRATLTADATDVTIGMDRIYVHRMLYATATHDTRRLA